MHFGDIYSSKMKELKILSVLIGSLKEKYEQLCKEKGLQPIYAENEVEKIKILEEWNSKQSSDPDIDVSSNEISENVTKGVQR
jgi:hypothetical protein